MEDRYLKYFIEICRHKNISRAATYLFVTQSSLSQFLNKEEEDLGVKLFIRDKKGLKLTYAGELYKKACEDILEIQSKLYHSLSDLEQSKTGKTRFGITPQWGGIVFARILPKFIEKFPLASLKFYEDTAYPLLEAIADNALDLALIALDVNEPLQYPNFPIQREEMLLAVPKTFTAGESYETDIPVVNLNHFQKFPFILSKERTLIRDITDNMFLNAGFIPKVICEMNNHIASLEMTENNFGISIIPHCYMIENQNIKYFSIAPRWYWDISIVMRRGYVLSKADEYIISLLKEYYHTKDSSYE